MIKTLKIFILLMVMGAGICRAQSSLPIITQQPSDVVTQVGKTATFAVVASGATSYQWWDSIAGGPFTVMAGQTTASRTTGTLALTNNGNKYYCVVSNSAGSITSNTVLLTVTGLPVITITVTGTNMTCVSPQACGTNADCLGKCVNTPTGFQIQG